MKIIEKLKSAAATAFGYDAVEDSGKRKAVMSRRRPEDQELTKDKRQRMTSSTRDLQRNFAIAAWAIRKHLDYVSTFEFQANTGDDKLDDAIEEFMRWYMKPANCDAAGRMSLPRMVRMAEARRTLDGDAGINFLSDGRLQGIEGDRITDPKEQGELPEGTRYVHGVLVNDYGRAIGYAVHKRSGINGEGLEYERTLGAFFFYLHGYFDRWDQVRGISPLSPAINPLRDVYENFSHALAKAKVSQMFALAFYREKAAEMGFTSQTGTQSSESTEAEEGAEEHTGYQVDFGKGPIMLDLDPGDKAEFLESDNPSSNFQDFTTQMIAVALKALDIPFSFYDESHTNYSGQRQAWIQYDESAEGKREDNRALLNWITARRLVLALRDGDLQLPRGMTIARMLAGCHWINRGIPWIDPLKEINADIAAIKAGQLGPETSARRKGLDVYKQIDERARVEKYAREHPLGAVQLEYMAVPVVEEREPAKRTGAPK